MFLEISQKSQKNSCARVSFLIKLPKASNSGTTLSRKRLWHGCFSVTFAKFLRALFFQSTSGRLLLYPMREIIPGFLSFYFRILSFLNFAMATWFCRAKCFLSYFYHKKLFYDVVQTSSFISPSLRLLLKVCV